MRKKLEHKLVNCFKKYLGENLVSIVLFGSRARNESHLGSDYDLFLIAEELPENYWERIKFIRRAYIGRFKERISIISQTKEEVVRGFPPFYLDIALDGKILYDKNFFQPRLRFIKKLIRQAGLERRKMGKEFYWHWRKQPKIGWKLGWEGMYGF